MQKQFNYQSFLTYIVLALVAAVLIHLMFKFYVTPKPNNKLYNENMTNINNNNRKSGCRSCVKPNPDPDNDKFDYYTNPVTVDSDDNSLLMNNRDNRDNWDNVDNTDNTELSGISYGPSYGSGDDSDNIFSNNNNNNNNNDNNDNYACAKKIKNKQNRIKNSADNKIDWNAQMDEITGIASKTPNYPDCRVCESENTYTREFYLNNEQPCEPKIDKLSDNQQQGYRDNFFNFRNYTWQTSHGVDAIDLLNSEYLSTSGNMFNPTTDKNSTYNRENQNITNGNKIMDVYDAITTDTYKTKDMMISPNYDNITMTPQFKRTASNGDYYTDDMWLYKKDRVMNGGEFYDGVSGFSSDKDVPQALSYSG